MITLSLSIQLFDTSASSGCGVSVSTEIYFVNLRHCVPDITTSFVFPFPFIFYPQSLPLLVATWKWNYQFREGGRIPVHSQNGIIQLTTLHSTSECQWTAGGLKNGCNAMFTLSPKQHEIKQERE